MKTKDPTQSVNSSNVAQKLLKKGEVAQLLRVTTRTVDEYMRRGLIGFIRIGRTIRFKEEDLLAHLRDNCCVQARGELRSAR